MSAHDLTIEPVELPSARQIAQKLATVALLVGVGVVVATQLPGVRDIGHQLAGADTGWITVALILELASTASFALAFHGVYDRRPGARASTSMSLAVQGMNIVLPSGGAGGLAVGAVLLDRAGVPLLLRRQPDRGPVPRHEPRQLRGRRDRRLRRRVRPPGRRGKARSPPSCPAPWGSPGDRRGVPCSSRSPRFGRRARRPGGSAKPSRAPARICATGCGRASSCSARATAW